jgi:hypothetical protein
MTLISNFVILQLSVQIIHDDGLSMALFVTIALAMDELPETRKDLRSGTQCMSVVGTREFICIALLLTRARAKHLVQALQSTQRLYNTYTYIHHDQRALTFEPGSPAQTAQRQHALSSRAPMLSPSIIIQYTVPTHRTYSTVQLDLTFEPSLFHRLPGARTRRYR